ncbi:hypothetical protein M409DRAFT_48762 [Zasmidium cellare ATCC 36951]|uniref:RapZ C-terminal domain-containing protein n=1 Tax=Zasmidium cellare ATCC 36951 TaxID=1080233 RepID=A0A6A6D361_ZASCE|nr:uncharacterized protein M409DRAFT_48762 [Zasmidium cellare ATCC 36951]KAF2173844.1 hypothetical protein M409DRAFT_48762 [Zasmidium cellare ATCC 36951]
MSEESHVTLAIWSHSHAPPLIPAAEISFDLRRVTNPPKHIRDSYDGRSKRLREHLLHDATFVNLLQSAMEEILKVANIRHDDEVLEQASHPEETGFVAGAETTTSSSPPATGPSNRTTREDNPSDDDTREAENADDEEAQAQTASQTTEYDSDQEEPDSSSGEIEPGESESESDSSRLLRISCFCERGRHRSVAFAEELGRMAWPRGWDVLVRHRDVDGQGGGKKRRNGRSGREDGRRGGKRGLAFGFGPDGDEP